MCNLDQLLKVRSTYASVALIGCDELGDKIGRQLKVVSPLFCAYMKSLLQTDNLFSKSTFLAAYTT